MASAVELVLFGVVLLAQTWLAAVVTRFFRIRLETTWGWLVYSAMLTPVVLLVSTFVFTGLLGIGPDLGSPAVAVAVTIGLPLVLGMTVDVLYAPAPEEYDLPETAD